MPNRAVRIPSDLDQRLQSRAKERGFRTTSAFMRAAIENEVGQRSVQASIQEQNAASFDRLHRELRRLLRSQQAIFALVDALTRVVVTCVPEPTSDKRSQAVATAKDWYLRLMKSAGQTMTSEALPAMDSLLNYVKE